MGPTTTSASSAPSDQAGPATTESGQGSTRSARSDEVPGLQLDNEKLIHLVEERPPLWDPEDCGHTDRELMKRKWLEICKELCENWDTLTPSQKRACREKIVTWWGSIRDRFIRDCHQEEQKRSETGGKRRRTYAYEGILQFLRRAAGLRKTYSSTLEPEAVPEEELVAPTVPHVSSQDTSPPLEDTLASGLTSQNRIADCFWESGQRPSASRSRPRELENLTRLTREALSKLEDKLDRQRLEDMQRRLEGAGPSTAPPSSNHDFLQSLLSWMEELTPEETHECRTRIQQAVFEIRHRPRLPTHTQSHPLAPPPTHTHLPTITPPSHALPPAYQHTYAPPPAHSYTHAYPLTYPTEQPHTSYAHSHSFSATCTSFSTPRPTPTTPQTHTLSPSTPATS